jgi:hypothetical protein
VCFIYFLLSGSPVLRLDTLSVFFVQEHAVTMPTTWVMACSYGPSGSVVACGYVIVSASFLTGQSKLLVVSSRHSGFLHHQKGLIPPPNVLCRRSVTVAAVLSTGRVARI